MVNNRLLSIIVPTKNRFNTAKRAIEIAMQLQSDEFEIIVQDCSDNDELLHYAEKVADPRLNYQRTPPVSLTQNWNNALGRASGEYVIFIGDDDCVLASILPAVRWTKARRLDALCTTKSHWYVWPGTNGLQGHMYYHEITGRRMEINFAQVRKALLKEFELERMTGLAGPSIYHCLVKKALLDALKRDTGVYFDATSPDSYSVTALCFYCHDTVLVDYPITLRGTSPSSNTGRLWKKDKNYMAHYNEFKDPDWPRFLPHYKLMINHRAIGLEAKFKALRNLKRPELFPWDHVVRMYAFTFVSRHPWRIRFAMLRYLVD